jgi:hypothetical protein
MFDLAELDRWDEALASLSSEAPVQTPETGGRTPPRAAPAAGPMRTGGRCPFGHDLPTRTEGRTTHAG